MRLQRRDQGHKADEIDLDLCSDTDFAQDIETRRAMTCGMAIIDDMHYSMFARRQGVQSTSSGEAELYGGSSTVMDGRCVKYLFEWIGYRVNYRLHVDSSAAKAMIQRDGFGKLQHMDVRALWIQAERREHGLRVFKVPGERNPADLGTKAHTRARFELLRDLAGIVGCAEVDAHETATVTSIEVVNGGSGGKHAKGGVSSATAALLIALLTERAEGAVTSESCAVKSNDWKDIVIMLLMTLLVIAACWVTTRGKAEEVACTAVPTERVIALPCQAPVATRTVHTQSMTTYRRKWSKPEFKMTSEDGAWSD